LTVDILSIFFESLENQLTFEISANEFADSNVTPRTTATNDNCLIYLYII